MDPLTIFMLLCFVWICQALAKSREKRPFEFMNRKWSGTNPVSAAITKGYNAVSQYLTNHCLHTLHVLISPPRSQMLPTSHFSCNTGRKTIWSYPGSTCQIFDEHTENNWISPIAYPICSSCTTGLGICSSRTEWFLLLSKASIHSCVSKSVFRMKLMY
jgi:hypothetical protein